MSSTVRSDHTSVSTTSYAGNPTIAPYTTDLNGVNMLQNDFFQDCLWWSMGILAMLVILVRLVEIFNAHLRRISAMTATKMGQEYWGENGTTWLPWVKKNLVYAPLGKKRHNREIRLSSALNMGTVPSRFHTLLLLAYIFSNCAYMLVLDYSEANQYEVFAELRGRSGSLAVVNMIPLFILAARNNLLIPMLKVSFDTYNLLHRWIGRMVVFESIVHTGAWAYCEYYNAGTSGIWDKLMSVPFLSYGAIGTIISFVMLILSLSPIRHAFYETFLNTHIILAAGFVAMVYIHCDLGQLPQLPYILAIIFLWVFDRLWRFSRIVYYNYSSRGWTQATVEAMPGESCRVTLHLPRHVHIKPGSHAYLRFSKVNIWESHPFSVAWTQDYSINEAIRSLPRPATSEKPLPRLRGEQLRTDVSFIIQAQTGMTRKLFNLADRSSDYRKPISLKACFEGPYGGHHQLDSYGHCVLFAGASGITHQVPYLPPLIQGCGASRVATRRITLVWVVREIEHLEWVRPWMDQILQIPGRREILNIKIFVTRPKNSTELHSPSATVKMFPGRPNIQQIMDEEMDNRVGAMAVTVCGPGGFADNVRDAVRTHVEDGVVDFIEESFTW